MFSGFHIGKLFIGTYGIFALIGIMAAFPISVYYYKKRTGDDISMILVYLWAALGVVLGMHLLFGITNISYWGKLLEAKDFLDFLKRFGAIFSGSVFYGGLLGGLAAGGIAVKRMKLPADIVTDCAAPFIAIMHGFARIGCFFGGCCYGVEWERGITFTDSIVKSANGVPRVPVQLFEAGFEFILGGVLWYLLTRSMKTGKLQGKLLALYLLIYPVGRFILEFWRGDEYRGFIFGLSTSQFISIVVFICALGYLIFRKAKPKKNASE